MRAVCPVSSVSLRTEVLDFGECYLRHTYPRDVVINNDSGLPARFEFPPQDESTLPLAEYGPKEIKAWTIPIGATAPQAAGAIHSDFERGFIRAEVYAVEDLQQHGSEPAIRSAGKLRVEGKSYIVQDGDVCHFLFNV